MSRTDAHAPVAIRLAYGELYAVAWHSSEHAVCDLPPRSEVERPATITRCVWLWQYTGARVCSCRLCSNSTGRRQYARRERRRTVARLAAATRLWVAGDDAAFDDEPPGPRRRRDWWR